MILDFDNFINEGKQRGDLYHLTTIISLLKIIDSNTLGDVSLGKYATVSLTRNKNFYKETKIIPNECYLTIDGDKLSTKYKIKPYQWHKNHFFNKKTDNTSSIEDQYEEEVQGYIKNIKRYVKEIIIFDIDLDPIIFDDDYAPQIGEILNMKYDEIRHIDIINWIKSKGYKLKII